LREGISELMASAAETVILSLNSGSSSLKFGLFKVGVGEIGAEGSEPQLLYTGEVDGIGAAESSFSIKNAVGRVVHEDRNAVAGQAEALGTVTTTLATPQFPKPDAIGHRVVHGGPKLRAHQLITPEVLVELEAAAQFAPLHVPVALSLIRLTQKEYPAVPQFACFDTAFHSTLSEQASRFALPDRFWGAGVRRYGFHGLSCESILHKLGADVPPRVIIAHLGSGASITAIADGKSVDTTMGLTPTGGIVMGTRTGDLDPGVLLYILRNTETKVDGLETLLDKESGLRGISGFSSDMRDLDQAASNNPRARMAIDIFCRTAKKAIGAFIAILGGLELLVFSGGIGEHDAAARAQICSGLDALGISLDAEANQKNLRQISSAASPVKVNVIVSDEDTQIARHTYRLFRQIRPA
jgi:acetate kinase